MRSVDEDLPISDLLLRSLMLAVIAAIVTEGSILVLRFPSWLNPSGTHISWISEQTALNEIFIFP